MYDQAELLEVHLTRDKYTLVVLQSCPLDVFKSYLNDNGNIDLATGVTSGESLRAKTFATHPYVWLARGFTDWYPDARVFTGHPALNDSGRMLDQFRPSAPRALYRDVAQQDWHAADHFPRENIHTAWQWFQSSERYHTPHDDVFAEFCGKQRADKTIVVLRSPQFQLASGTRLSEAEYRHAVGDVLDAATAMAAGGTGQSVVTAMHGASFQAPSAYNIDWLDRDRVEFTPGLNVEELTKVPWFIVDDSDSA
mgnify:CR=1 FL=1